MIEMKPTILALIDPSGQVVATDGPTFQFEPSKKVEAEEGETVWDILKDEEVLGYVRMTPEGRVIELALGDKLREDVKDGQNYQVNLGPRYL